MNDSPAPISDEHKAFARELVALARKHGSSKLVVEFDLASSARFRGHRDDWTNVKLTWAEGRHGANEKISLRAEAFSSFDEKEEN